MLQSMAHCIWTKPLWVPRRSFWIDATTPVRHLKCRRQDCFASVLNTMIEYKRFWGDGQSVCHPGWPVYRPGYQGLLFEKSAHGGNFFACWPPPGLWPSGTERVWHPYSGNGQANMADQTSATIVRLVQTGEVHQLSIFDHYVGEIDAPYYS